MVLCSYAESLLERLIPSNNMEHEALKISTKRIGTSYPLISVIVPVYNVESYIEHCIESILKQTFTNFELLLIDDGSTDGSNKICNKYCEKDARCKTIHKANNKGGAEARNTGLDHAMGDYIAFIDADDYVYPQYLEILYKTGCENECEISVVDFEKVPDMYYEASYEAIKYYNTRSLCQKDLMEKLFSKTSFMVVWGKLYKRELLQEFRFKSFYIAEDIEFNSRVYQAVHKATFSDVKLYYWINRPSSVTRILFSQRNIDAIDCYNIALSNIDNEKKDYRAYALQRLYKVMLYTRYNASNKFKTAIKYKVMPIVDETLPELVHSRHIPTLQKYSLIAFLYIPFLYNLFRFCMERKTFLRTI